MKECCLSATFSPVPNRITSYSSSMLKKSLEFNRRVSLENENATKIYTDQMVTHIEQEKREKWWRRQCWRQFSNDSIEWLFLVLRRRRRRLLRYNSMVHIYMHWLQANHDTLHFFNTLALLSCIRRMPIDVDSCILIGTSEHNWLTTSRKIFFSNRPNDIILPIKSVILVECRRLGELSDSPLSLLSIDRKNNKLFSFFAVLDFDFFIVKILSCQNGR